jgi:hypothetical protein
MPLLASSKLLPHVLKEMMNAQQQPFGLQCVE